MCLYSFLQVLLDLHSANLEDDPFWYPLSQHDENSLPLPQSSPRTVSNRPGYFCCMICQVYTKPVGEVYGMLRLAYVSFSLCISVTLASFFKDNIKQYQQKEKSKIISVSNLFYIKFKINHIPGWRFSYSYHSIQSDFRIYRYLIRCNYLGMV